ncbi:glycosyltransferase [Bacteroides sp. BFG-551]|nr:glycosyltransferase [Bacteroides sp. BFG-551]
MKVSVIVPVYNCEDWLRQCVDSLICEDSPCEQEIILVDDGSTDGSGKICDEYTSRYKCLKTIHTVNQGVSCARNLGPEQSSGEWILFIDGDDVLIKNALNILYHQIQFYKYDLTRFGMYLFKNSKKIHSYEASFSCDREEYIDLVIQRKANLGVAGGIYKRSLFFEHEIRFPLVFVLVKIGLCCLSYCVMRIAFIITMLSYTDIE